MSISLRILVGQIVVTAVIVVVLLGLLSVLGLPTQRMVDVGQWLQVRLFSRGAMGGGDAGNQGLAPAAAVGAKNGETPETAETIHLLLPPALYTTVGKPVHIEYDNIVLSTDSERYRFGVACQDCPWSEPYGRRRWTATPPEAGEYGIFIGVTNLDFSTTLASGQSFLRVASVHALTTRKPRILIFGDSITRQHWWVNGLARRLNDAGVADWTMLGREYKDGSPPFSEPPLPGVRHEAEYGWSMSSFSSFVAANEKEKTDYRRARSPFVFGDSPSDATLDIPRYYQEVGDGLPADFVVMQAGINDVWGADASDPVLLKQRLDITLAYAEKLADAFLGANPTTHVGMILPAPFTRNERQFNEAYNGAVTRWGARQVQHALVQAMIQRFKEREGERLWLLPLYATFDTLDGYPIDNAGHPNAYGQSQIADTVFAWMSWVAASEMGASQVGPRSGGASVGRDRHR